MKSRVAITRCKDYDKEGVYSSLKQVFNLLGGIEKYLSAGQKVLIKPNMLSQRPPESGAGTHPEFVRALIRIVRDAGALPMVGDSPGGTIKYADLVYEKCGMKRICEEEKCPLVKFDKAININGFPVADAIREVDLIINAPKAKTHNLMTITGALKNNFGFLCGLAKTQYHLEHTDIYDFANVLVDVYECIKPRISIMDAVYAMEGEGPVGGGLRNLGLIIASEDAVALDSAFCHIIGLNPRLVPALFTAEKRRLGKTALGEIEILGEKIENVKAERFMLPPQIIYTKVPKFLLGLVKKLVKFLPTINMRLCAKCRICETACPRKAITISDTQCIIDYKKCIRCMCCFEFCPHGALFMKRSLLARIGTRNWEFKGSDKPC
ncbi:MAG: DUF362 domain-containing protein [Candidatus Omnitrophota bacterium]